MTFSIPNTVS